MPLDEIILRATTSSHDEPTESVKQHTYTAGIGIDTPEASPRKVKKKFTLYRSEAKEQGLADLKAKGRHTLNSLLIKRSFRILNEYHHKRKEEIDDAQLVDLLLDAYPTIFGDEMTMYSSYDAGMNGLKDSDVQTWDFARTACESASAWAREHWDAQVYADIQARARAGGRAGKKYTEQDFLDTRGMRKVEIARRLNLSRPTVDKMIEEYENKNLGEQQ